MCNECNMQLIQNHNHDNYYKLTNIQQHKIKTTNQNYVLYDCTHSQEGRNLNLKYYTPVYVIHISANQKFCNYDQNLQNILQFNYFSSLQYNHKMNMNSKHYSNVSKHYCVSNYNKNTQKIMYKTLWILIMGIYPPG